MDFVTREEVNNFLRKKFHGETPTQKPVEASSKVIEESSEEKE